MIYQWKNGARMGKLDAQVIGEHLESLRTQLGSLTPDTVVQDARPKSAPTHSAFTWNVRQAAEERWLDQARELIRSVVFISDDQPDSEPIRAFVVVKEDGEQHYTSTVVALSDEELRAQVLARASRELADWQKRYRELREFSDVFRIADEVRGRLAA